MCAGQLAGGAAAGRIRLILVRAYALLQLAASSLYGCQKVAHLTLQVAHHALRVLIRAAPQVLGVVFGGRDDLAGLRGRQARDLALADQLLTLLMRVAEHLLGLGPGRVQ
jgi:hypothetical protein